MVEPKGVDQLRRDYSAPEPLERGGLDPEPTSLFRRWLDRACSEVEHEPNAMTLSTVDTAGRPALRTVLLKYFDTSGFVFFTNLGSRKAQHIEGNAQVALLFCWHKLGRQVEIRGRAQRVAAPEVEKYFATRPRGSQLGAWASPQSQVVASRAVLDDRLAEVARKYPTGQPVPLPSFWGGFRVKPESIEFWQGRPNRLHDRFRYLREGQTWRIDRLAP